MIDHLFGNARDVGPGGLNRVRLPRFESAVAARARQGRPAVLREPADGRQPARATGSQWL